MVKPLLIAQLVSISRQVQGSTPVKVSIDGYVVKGVKIAHTAIPGRKELVLELVSADEVNVPVAAPVVVEPEPEPVAEAPTELAPLESVPEDDLAGEDEFAYMPEEEDEDDEAPKPTKSMSDYIAPRRGRPKKNL